MPIRPENKGRYPANWKAISKRIRNERAGNRCEWCDAVNGALHPVTTSRVVLTVAHLDHTPENCDEANLAALCQRCHLNYDRQHHQETRGARLAAAEALTEPFTICIERRVEGSA